jgi:AraC-like DNA-binding protein
VASQLSFAGKFFQMRNPAPEAFIKTVHRLLETQQYFLIPTLRAEDVAKEMGMGYQKFSALLNTQLNSNFNDFINGYRIRYACGLMTTGKMKAPSKMADIASESGFSSRSVFYEAFRKVMGITPGEYLLQSSERRLKKDTFKRD